MREGGCRLTVIRTEIGLQGILAEGFRQGLHVAANFVGRFRSRSLGIAGAALGEHDLELSGIDIAAYREAQRSGTSMIEQCDATSGK